MSNLDERTGMPARLIGASRAIQTAREQIAVAARGRFPIWIQGEDGADRERVAQRIHAESDWSRGRFFALDAGVIPPALVGRELLGAAEGAIPALPASYTGAFERCAGGTVLVEDLKSVPKDVQQTIAVALGEGHFRPIGAEDSLPFECRLIGSGRTRLEAAAGDPNLIGPLAERFGLLEIVLPPLRERPEDIVPLAAEALALARAEIEREPGQVSNVRGFSPAAIERLVTYGWPGNERELREQIRAALHLAKGNEIALEDLVLGWDSDASVPPFRDAKRAFEREYVTRLLRLCRGNISRAARIARKDRKDFYDVMRRNSIKPQDFR
ncbi:MAG: sigma-54-dependent transcriptional regulator [Myxococcota bacterium]